MSRAAQEHRQPPEALDTCGTRHGYQTHLSLDQDPCLDCAAANAAYARARYQATKARPRDLQPCGTEAAYQRHRNHGETPCGPCRAANTAASAARRARRAQGSP